MNKVIIKITEKKTGNQFLRSYTGNEEKVLKVMQKFYAKKWFEVKIADNNDLEKRYAEFDYKAQWVALSDVEQKEYEMIVEALDLKECDNCHGEGGKEFPSMMGYGSEFLTCKKCEGVGHLGLSQELKNELKKNN